MSYLTEKHCLACEAGVSPLTNDKIQTLILDVPGWTLTSDGMVISRRFDFKGFYKTMAFVNAVAWVANQENHHPDLEITFNHCLVKYTTHAIKGLSENDFICAAKVNALIEDNSPSTSKKQEGES